MGGAVEIGDGGVARPQDVVAARPKTTTPTTQRRARDDPDTITER
jgi:hypothetical protein